MYGVLIHVLLSGEIKFIGCCKTCGSFTHYATRPKKYCSTKCHDVFWRTERKESGSSNDLAILALRQMQIYITDNRVRDVEDLPLTRSGSQFAKLRNLLGDRFDVAVLKRLWNESPEAIAKTLSVKVSTALSQSL